MTPNRGKRDPTAKPPAEFVSKTHMKIENKTKKPNLAKLNNTTFDENSQMGHRLKSPTASTSPGPRREIPDARADRDKDLGTSVDLDSGSLVI